METSPLIHRQDEHPDTLLTYSHQQNRLDRRILWVIGIVCVSHALTLPAAVWHAQMLPGQLGRTLGWPILFERAYLLTLLIGQWALIPLGSLCVASLALLVLLRVRSPQRALTLCAASTAVVVGCVCVAEVAFTLLDAVAGVLNRKNDASNNAMIIMHIVRHAALLGFPLVFLAAVLYQDKNGSSRRVASVIWWFTVGACLLVAAPTVFEWIVRPQNGAVIANRIIGGRSLRESIHGIGLASAAAASFCVVLTVLWMIIRWTQARSALMVCAALWAVSAVAVEGNELGRRVYDFGSWILVGKAIGVFPRSSEYYEMAIALRYFATAMAFPIAVRIAMRFSDVSDERDQKSPSPLSPAGEISIPTAEPIEPRQY